MAIGFGSKGGSVDNAPPEASPDSSEAKDGAFGNYDTEGQDEKGRKMSRIGGPDVIGDNTSQISVGAQIELEGSNAIKYRTCSWQKVVFNPISLQSLRLIVHAYLWYLARWKIFSLEHGLALPALPTFQAADN